MNKEVWKDIKGFENLYQVSNLGRIKSLKRYNPNPKYIEERILKTKIKKNGYVEVGLYKKGKKYFKTVHRLVADVFVDNIKNKKEVNHKDGNKQNNNADNLEWVTRSENQKHAFKLGLQKVSEHAIKNCLKHVEKTKVKVKQYDLNNNYIQTFDSIEEANRYLKENYNVCGHVWECIVGKRKKTGGFKWEREVMQNVRTK